MAMRAAVAHSLAGTGRASTAPVTRVKTRKIESMLTPPKEKLGLGWRSLAPLVLLPRPYDQLPALVVSHVCFEKLPASRHERSLRFLAGRCGQR